LASWRNPPKGDNHAPFFNLSNVGKTVPPTI
jgi:hypothetical protein